jgi:hypothetical protein
MRRLAPIPLHFSLVLVWLALSVPAAAELDRPATSDACGVCHKDIYRMWRASAHADCMENEIFLAAYRETEILEGEKVAEACLRCHAPLAEIIGDPSLQRKVTWEGVNCEVCHSMVSVDLSGPIARHTFDLSDVKRGPIKDAASSAHEVAYSELHTTSLVCAGCHEFTNSEGTSLMTTYAEWKASSASSEGQTCQSCHMWKTEAQVVDPRIARVPDAEVNLHEMPGGHSLEQLHKALRVALKPRRDGDTLVVAIELINKGAGHAVPTGMPGRRVILDLEVQPYTGEAMRETRTYGKFFVDAEGEKITRDSQYFAKGVRLASDSRIKADERRKEEFRLPVPVETTVSVSLKLHYEHAPTGGDEGLTRFTFYSESRTLTP